MTYEHTTYIGAIAFEPDPPACCRYRIFFSEAFGTGRSIIATKCRGAFSQAKRGPRVPRSPSG